jgi:hypothetical protein
VYRQLIVAVIREFMREALNKETLTLREEGEGDASPFNGNEDPFNDIRAL